MSKIILLDSLRSLQNVGAIFRNCDGAGFEKVILTGYTPTPPRNDIAKTALGAHTWIDWEYYKDPLEAITDLKGQGYQIYCVELTNDAVEYTTLFEEKNDKICLILGNEVDGVSQELLDISDKNIIIAMRGKKESLNVSVAAGIVMYAV
ncbi:RNA methyltransferase [Candidatus Gracilibacteria bacterium]|nr:RNA methyltransferase [Candidatus Gracilibacteria bacterium]